MTDGLLTILNRARIVAQKNKTRLIHEGSLLKLDIQGKPKGTKPINFVIYHVPFDPDADKSIGSDVPKIDHTKIKHLELVRWTIKHKEACPDAEIIICTDNSFC